ncbi:hypothetical protein EDD15DRAFT_2193598 [Pisolithus albus]|nr:hypothetical protein EDD15DRAFT_2193598 [Pisolithus albus]
MDSGSLCEGCSKEDSPGWGEQLDFRELLPVDREMFTGCETLLVGSDDDMLGLHSIVLIWKVDITTSCARVPAVINAITVFFRKNPCLLQPVPRFYIPPTPGCRPDPPYPLDGTSATTGVSGTPDINDPPWGFSSHSIRPTSFTDLLQSSLDDVYDSPDGLATFSLPLPTTNSPTIPNQGVLVPGDVTAAPGQQAIGTVTPRGEGAKPRGETSVGLPTDHIPEALSVAGGVPPEPDRAVVSREECTNTGDDSTQGAALSDARMSRLPTGAGEAPHALNNASWMSRNPGHPVIPPRTSEKLDAAQRAVRKVAAEQRRVKQEAAHCILPEKVKLLITGETHYRNRREESLANALVRIKARQVNADRPCGQKIQLKELQEMVANDPEMQNLDEETKQKYLGELKETRSHKAKGVRSTNTAASRDVQATLKNIYEELQALAYRTGIYACLFVTRGHVYDTHAATWFGTDNIMDFWEDRMNLSPDYIIKQLELWACNEEKNIDARDSLENMQKQAKSGLDSGFSTITKHLRQEKPIRLRFANFEQIKYKFGIDYEGWPDGIPFSSPYKIQTIDEICRLRDAIRENSFQ